MLYYKNIKNDDDNDVKISEAFHSMYPEIYAVIYPEVEKQCDILQKNKGLDYMPSKQEIEQITNEVHENVNKHLSKNLKQDIVTKRYGRHGLRDIISIILLGELIRRSSRRRPNYPRRRTI